MSSPQYTRVMVFGLTALIYGYGVVDFSQYLWVNGYLPSPFAPDKSDTFMDLFNTMYWSYDNGRYTEWGSVYPPLCFAFLRMMHSVFAGGVSDGDPALMRESSRYVIYALILAFLALPAMLMGTSRWRCFSFVEKSLIYIAVICSAPMLFALERGNLILLCPILLTFALFRIGFVRCLCVALLINIKPYFVLLMIYFLARKNLKGFMVCTLLSFLVFVIPGMAIDANFLYFFANILDFSQEKELFSLREVMAMPSSISAFSYVLKTPDGMLFASSYIDLERIDDIVFYIEAVKWIGLAFSMRLLFTKSSVMRDAEILMLLIVVISNLGVWVGGYTLILYIALIPVFIEMRLRWWYAGLMVLMLMPLNFVTLLSDSIGEQYAYISDSDVNVDWSMGLDALIRPFANILLLSALSYEVFSRKQAWEGNVQSICCRGALI
jgi:hypothetical protein